MSDSEIQESGAFAFFGNWRDFGKIAVVNILLNIVTLSIYRFWATTRERDYLWRQTQFIDERLEWTGTGKELLLGFLMALVLLLLPLGLIQFVIQALALQGHTGMAALMSLVFYLGLFCIIGIARYRALRYRLSRTYWHGIRGGSDDQGFAYGWQSAWMTIVGSLALGLLVPWSMMNLWNERWSKMSFGPHRFDATAKYQDVFKRYLLFYLLPIFAIVFAIIGAFLGGANAHNLGMAFGFTIVGIYGGIGVIALAFYAKFFRVAIDGLSLHNLEFGFSARTKDWFMLMLGDIGLWIGAALVTLLPIGILIGSMGLMNGFHMPVPGEAPTMMARILPIAIVFSLLIPLSLVGPFIRYRHWKFFITHLQAYGEVNLDDLTQSTTIASKTGEGLLDAFDVGAI